MYQDDRNEFGCPLLGQRGAEGVRDFQIIIAHMSPPQRVAFEREQKARRRELGRLRASARLRRAIRLGDRAGARLGSAACDPSLWLGWWRECAEPGPVRRLASCAPRRARQYFRRDAAQASRTVRRALVGAGVCAALLALARVRRVR